MKRSYVFGAVLSAFFALTACEIGQDTYDHNPNSQNSVGGSSQAVTATSTSKATGGKPTQGWDTCRGEGVHCSVSSGGASSQDVAIGGGSSQDFAAGGASTIDAATGGSLAVIPQTGGASSQDVATGGSIATGGLPATGGGSSQDVATGGASTIDAATGGATTQDLATGGSSTQDFATGGTLSTGGTASQNTSTGGGSSQDIATGGASTIDVATGGASSQDAVTGGAPATGGQAATGGMEATGGSLATGGSSATGGACGTGGTTSVENPPPPQKYKFWITAPACYLDHSKTWCQDQETGEVVSLACQNDVYCYITLSDVRHDWACYVITGNPEMPRLPDDSSGECTNEWGVTPVIITSSGHPALQEGSDWYLDSTGTDKDGFKSGCVYHVLPYAGLN